MNTVKKICLLLTVLTLAVSGCGNSAAAPHQGGGTFSTSPTVNDVLEAGIAQADSAGTEASPGDSAESGTEASEFAIPEEAIPEETTTSAPVENSIPSAEESPVLADNNAAEAAVLSPDPVLKEADVAAASTEGIDIDLTVLSSDMVYAEVFDIMRAPSSYVGKTLRMHGPFVISHDPSTGNDYYICIIEDALACCAQGIEFVPADGYSYPEDFPEVNSDITVTGVFDTYYENDMLYCTVRDSTIDL